MESSHNNNFKPICNFEIDSKVITKKGHLVKIIGIYNKHIKIKVLEDKGKAMGIPLWMAVKPCKERES